MKQLKKFSTLLLLLVTMAMVATSCKKDDDEANINSDLVGTWVGEEDDWREVFTFNKNGSVAFTYTDEYGTEKETWEWTATKNTITITFEDGETETYRYTISSNGKALDWEWDDEVTYFKQ